MAMQPLHQEIEPAPNVLTPHDHPVLQGLMADQATAHAEEVRLLRQRVAVLEAALAAAKAAPATEAAVSDPGVTASPTSTIITSEFSESATPAVVAYTPPAAAPAPTPEQSPTQAAPAADKTPAMADQAFANAWSDDEDSSFEERIAQKAFFQVGSVDEQSRKWLLTS